jgi:uncharacterized membrane protein YfcA
MPTRLIQSNRLRIYLYPSVLFLIYLVWGTYLFVAERWSIFGDWWPMSLTMAFGSFVAGATAAGGAAVAFPVFTKLLQIPAEDARTFGLMIQSAGMTMASLVILTRRIKILPDVVSWVSVGGALGMVVGSLLIPIPPPYPKILFTFVIASFGIALTISRWLFQWEPHNDFCVGGWPRRLLFIAIGVIGGIFASNTGSGIDMLTFIVLTLVFGVNEKVGTPTTVIIMAINSLIGFFIHGAVIQDIGIVWEYWLACVPVVILGAPLGAYVAGRVGRDAIIYLLLTLILAELTTTILLIPFTSDMVTVTWGTVIVCTLGFAAMLIYRHHHIVPAAPADLNPRIGSGPLTPVEPVETQERA